MVPETFIFQTMNMYIKEKMNSPTTPSLGTCLLPYFYLLSKRLIISISTFSYDAGLQRQTRKFENLRYEL